MFCFFQGINVRGLDTANHHVESEEGSVRGANSEHVVFSRGAAKISVRKRKKIIFDLKKN